MAKWYGFSFLVALGACGGQDISDAPDPTDKLFDIGHIIEVDIELADSDWQELRFQGRQLSELAEGCDEPRDEVYEFFPGTVTVDGETVAEVGVRKKGFLGSLSVSRPSLKMKFDEFVPDQSFSGMKRLTLNNNRQDPSQVRQCMAYEAFRRAGLPSPRCSIARVTVNGEDLGIYTHVESIKKAFLRRNFGDDSGNLYEGQLSDFREGLTQTFQQKTNEMTPADDIARVTAALAITDDSWLDEISELIDLDSFMSFWAMENMAGTWDGYSNNLNNFYMYKNPRDNKLHFIPWGTDIAFTEYDQFARGDKHQFVSANSLLANRLYEHPATRKQYIDRVNQLLDSAWDEGALSSYLDRMLVVLGDQANADGIASIRAFISDRRQTLKAEMGGPLPDWDAGLRDAECWTTADAIEVHFAAEWESFDDMFSGEGQVFINGEEQEGTVWAQAGLFQTVGDEQPTIRVSWPNGAGTIGFISIEMEPNLFVADTTIPTHAFSNFAVIGTVDVSSLDVTVEAFISEGLIRLDQASEIPGSPVSGSLTGTSYEPPAGWVQP